MKTTASLAVALLATGAISKGIPSNVQSFYNRIQNGKCNGGTNLKDGFYDRCFNSNSQCDCDGSNCRFIRLSILVPWYTLLTDFASMPQPSHTARTTNQEQSTFMAITPSSPTWTSTATAINPTKEMVVAATRPTPSPRRRSRAWSSNIPTFRATTLAI